MATGDIKNNLRKLRKEIQLIKYNSEVNYENLSKGLASSYLPILYHLVSDYCCELAVYLMEKDYDFFGKTDLRFIEVLYKILIQEFSTKPMLTKQQFFANGFAEKKAIFVARIIELFREKAASLTVKTKKSNPKNSKIKRKQSEIDKISSIVSAVFNSNNEHGSTLPPHLVVKTESKEAETKSKNSIGDHHLTGEVSTSLTKISPPTTNKFLTNHGKDFVEKKSVSFQEPPVDFVLHKTKSISSQETETKSTPISKPIGNSFSQPLTPYSNDITIQSSTVNKSLSSISKYPDPLEVSLIEDDVEFHESKHISSFDLQKNPFGTADVYLVDENLSSAKMLSSNVIETEGFKLQPNEKPQAFVKNKANKLKQCGQCEENKNDISKLQSKINKLENQLEKVLIINNELEAKIILLETRVDIVESSKNLHKPVSKQLERMSLQDVTNDVLNLSNIENLTGKSVTEKSHVRNENLRHSEKQNILPSNYLSPGNVFTEQNFKQNIAKARRHLHKNSMEKVANRSPLKSSNYNKDCGQECFENELNTLSKFSRKENVKDVWNNSFDYMCESTKSTIALLQQQIKETKLLFSKNDV